MSNVVSLNGAPVENVRAPDPEVIKELRWLLAAAEAGEVNGIAYAVHYFDGTSGNRWVGHLTRREVGALFGVMTRLSSNIDDHLAALPAPGGPA